MPKNTCLRHLGECVPRVTDVEFCAEVDGAGEEQEGTKPVRASQRKASACFPWGALTCREFTIWESFSGHTRRYLRGQQA